MYEVDIADGVIMKSPCIHTIWHAICHYRRYEKRYNGKIPGAVLHSPSGEILYMWEENMGGRKPTKGE